MHKQLQESAWVKTKEMASLLGVHRNTLGNLKTSGYFLEGEHYRKSNPTSPRGHFLWHRNRVLLKMDAL